jgi:hypothetical protein
MHVSTSLVISSQSLSITEETIQDQYGIWTRDDTPRAAAPVKNLGRGTREKPVRPAWRRTRRPAPPAPPERSSLRARAPFRPHSTQLKPRANDTARHDPTQSKTKSKAAKLPTGARRRRNGAQRRAPRRSSARAHRRRVEGDCAPTRCCARCSCRPRGSSDASPDFLVAFFCLPLPEYYVPGSGRGGVWVVRAPSTALYRYRRSLSGSSSSSEGEFYYSED